VIPTTNKSLSKLAIFLRFVMQADRGLQARMVGVRKHWWSGTMRHLHDADWHFWLPFLLPPA
jgi:hypothetical protein